MTEPGPRFDVVLVGGGLANALLAAAVLHRQPSARVALVEANPTLVHEKTWCFHGSDVPEGVWPWLQPFVAHRWNGYDVAFPGFERGFSSPYLAITGEGLSEALSALLKAHGAGLFLGRAAAKVHEGGVELEDGARLTGGVIVDGRGQLERRRGAGFQKFVGWEVEVQEGSVARIQRPLLMDASVEQLDGYRFFYVLPLSPRRFLFEDTYFSSQPALNVDVVEQRISNYLQANGWLVSRVVRREKGVLPMPWEPSVDEEPFSVPGVLKVGYRGGWYQPATGYSVPAALQVASAVAGAPTFSSASVKAAVEPLWRRHQTQSRFYRLLNRLAFRGVRDCDRRSVFQRFYRLPESLVSRFYAGRSTWWDRVRVLGGRPPVPLSRFQMARLMEDVS